MVRFAVRVREIPGSNPGGPTILLSINFVISIQNKTDEKKRLGYFYSLAALPETVDVAVAHRVQCP